MRSWGTTFGQGEGHGLHGRLGGDGNVFWSRYPQVCGDTGKRVHKLHIRV